MQAIHDGCYLLLVKGLSFCVYNLVLFTDDSLDIFTCIFDHSSIHLVGF